MGMIAKCKRCKKTYRYNSSEIRNIGTVWNPIWSVKCHNCSRLIKFNNSLLKVFDTAQIGLTKERVAIRIRGPRPPGCERARKGDIREYWIQKYFKAIHKKLGFSKIRELIDEGPDFKGVYKGQKTLIEIERTCKAYIEHEHHKDPRFNNVKVLVVLSPAEPSEKIRHKLPKTIIKLDIDDFVKWWRPKARAYAKKMRTLGIIELIANEFQRRFMLQCDDKDRDMAGCPACDFCPYFMEGRGYQAKSFFIELALKFIALYKYPITSDDFKLSSIKPSELDRFYKKCVYWLLMKNL